MKKIFIFTASILIILSLTAFADEASTFVARQMDIKINVDREEKKFENPVVVINERTYLPLRETAETLGMEVRWDQKNQMVDIITGERIFSESDYKDIDNIITETYPDEKLRSFIFPAGDFHQDSAMVPSQCIRYCGRYFYTVFRSIEGNLYFKMYDTRNGKMVSCAAWSLYKTYSLNELQKAIKIGETLFEEVEEMNLAGRWGDSRSVYDNSLMGLIWTNDGYLAIVYANDGKIVDSFEYYNNVYAQEKGYPPLLFDYLLKKDREKLFGSN